MCLCVAIGLLVWSCHLCAELLCSFEIGHRLLANPEASEQRALHSNHSSFAFKRNPRRTRSYLQIEGELTRAYGVGVG